MVERASTTFITPVVRASYAQLVTPKASAGSKDEKFSINLIFEPADASALYAEIVRIATEQFGANAAAMLQSGGLADPMKNGSTPNKKTLVVDPNTAGKYFVTAKAAKDKQPVCIGPDGSTAINPSTIYSGCYVRAQISIYSYKVEVNEGVAIGINYVQFVRDGERLGGGAPSLAEAKNMFGAVPGAGATAAPNLGFGGLPGGAPAGVLPGAPVGSLPGLPA